MSDAHCSKDLIQTFSPFHLGNYYGWTILALKLRLTIDKNIMLPNGRSRTIKVQISFAFKNKLTKISHQLLFISINCVIFYIILENFAYHLILLLYPLFVTVRIINHRYFKFFWHYKFVNHGLCWSKILFFFWRCWNTYKEIWFGSFLSRL